MIEASIIAAIAALIGLTWVGNLACRVLFRLTGLAEKAGNDSTGDAPAGRVIGSLERLVLAIGIITQSWPVFAAVIALKSVARFRELDDKTFAEYFLVGSLFSILWAVLVTGTWLWVDATWGLDLQDHVARPSPLRP